MRVIHQTAQLGTFQPEQALESCNLRDLPREHSNVLRRLDAIEAHPVMVRALIEQRKREAREALVALIAEGRELIERAG